MKGSWKIRMAQNMIRKEDPEEVMNIVEAMLPVVVDVLSKSQLQAFVKRLFQRHLSTLLRGMSRGERATLLGEILPFIAKEFPIEDIDFSPAQSVSS